MNVVIFAATGMVGQGVLRECLLDPDVQRALAVGRAPLGQQHENLHELLRKNLLDYSGLEDALTGYDACFFCLGVTSAGMSEADYRRVAVDIVTATGRALAMRNPQMTFVFVSGAGTDPASKTMWSRVKGEAENAVFALPVKAAYAFRPAFIQPMHGITSRTRSDRIVYPVMAPLFPLFKALLPRYVLTTEQVGRAMLSVAQKGAGKRILESQDIAALPPSEHRDGVAGIGRPCAISRTSRKARCSSWERRR